ncbi:hypothetical protein ACIOVF_20315 [Pseudomonas sp. NPDC087612]|uniref:hypothetical protein n=1 Tax=unclassified Pseudomonas TaxID=196821 RepID=UPI000A799637|nr:hypothetical protein [Pseudomonas sp. 2(2015)]
MSGFWYSWWAVAFMISPFTLAFIGLAMSIQITCGRDFNVMLSALPNSWRLQNRTTHFGNASLRSRWHLVNTVSGAMLYPGFCIRKGLFDPGELQEFPAPLKRKMIISSWLSIVGFAWLMIGAGLLKLSNG